MEATWPTPMICQAGNQGRSRSAIGRTDRWLSAADQATGLENPADQLFLKTLGEHDQIATLVPGICADNVFDSASRAQMKTILERSRPARHRIRCISPQRELEKGFSVLTKVQIKQKDPTMLQAMDNPAQRAQAIKDLAGIISTPSSLLTLSWIDRASKQSPVEAGKPKRGADTLETAAIGMSEHAKSKLELIRSAA
jgi:hypothetical protein